MAATPTTSIGYQNFFDATLTSDITATSTDIPLDNIPNSSEGFLVIDPDSEDSCEVIYYTSKTALKVVCPSVADGRGQDDTSATTHQQGTVVIMAPVAAYFEALLSLFTTTPQGWTALAGNFTGPVCNGNRSYTVTTSSDQSAIVSPGMRVRTTRTVAAPNQCTDLESGSSQYYSKTSPSGMTFTDDFVVSAWVKLESYGTTGIASRYNGTSGWEIYIASDGRVTMLGHNAASGNYSQVQSLQSVPLGRWVHIAAQLDMSAFTATTTTSYVMIDGADVPAQVTRAGTNPTALIQAGDLQIGALNGTNYFDGKLAQVAIFSAKVTQATIRTYISQAMSGAETSTISVYSFNNAITDLNANANNLTAQGSAVATNADSPFGVKVDGTISTTLDYGIVTAVTASTLTIQVPEGNTIPTSGGISAMSYSTYKTPFGFPASRNRWAILTIYCSQQTQATATANTWYNVGSTQLNVPIGAWELSYKASAGTSSATGTSQAILTLSTSASAETNNEFTLETFIGTGQTIIQPFYTSSGVVLAAATPYYLIGAVTSGGTPTIYFGETVGSTARTTTMVKAELAYL